jgi:hypothetical protein
VKRAVGFEQVSAVEDRDSLERAVHGVRVELGVEPLDHLARVRFEHRLEQRVCVGPGQLVVPRIAEVGEVLHRGVFVVAFGGEGHDRGLPLWRLAPHSRSVTSGSERC